MKVVTLERFSLNHEKGSSHGGTRIIRLAYYEDPRYVPLLKRAFELWRGLEVKSGKELLRTTGGLMVGKPDGELVEGVLKSAREHRLKHSVLSAREAGERFGIFRLSEDLCAVYEDSAGVLFPEECIGAFVSLARDEGCEFRFSEPVLSWRSTEGAMEVETTRGRYEAGNVVFCAGAWNGALAPGVVPTTCERQVPFWFNPGKEGKFGSGKMPVFIWEEDRSRFFYGIPDVGHGVKVARTHGGESCNPDQVRREVTAEDYRPVADFIGARINGLRGPPIASTTCIYTNTPDLNFAIGKLPREPRVTLVSACSGHGFKFASVVGEVAAGLVAGEAPRHDISFLGLDRFGKAPAEGGAGPH